MAQHYGGTIASNVSFRSEGAGIRVGQMVDAMIKERQIQIQSISLITTACLALTGVEAASSSRAILRSRLMLVGYLSITPI